MPVTRAIKARPAVEQHRLPPGADRVLTGSGEKSRQIQCERLLEGLNQSENIRNARIRIVAVAERCGGVWATRVPGYYATAG